MSDRTAEQDHIVHEALARASELYERYQKINEPQKVTRQSRIQPSFYSRSLDHPLGISLMKGESHALMERPAR